MATRRASTNTSLWLLGPALIGSCCPVLGDPPSDALLREHCSQQDVVWYGEFQGYVDSINGKTIDQPTYNGLVDMYIMLFNRLSPECLQVVFPGLADATNKK